MGLNECAGYLALAGAALLTATLADRFGLRPSPFYPGVVFAAAGMLLSWLFVRETHGHVALESTLRGAPAPAMTARQVFWRTTAGDRNLSSISQAGMINNLNDGMARGLFPLLFAAAHVGLTRIGVLAALYPATWSILQLGTGALWTVSAGNG